MRHKVVFGMLAIILGAAWTASAGEAARGEEKRLSIEGQVVNIESQLEALRKSDKFIYDIIDSLIKEMRRIDTEKSPNDKVIADKSTALEKRISKLEEKLGIRPRVGPRTMNDWTVEERLSRIEQALGLF